MAPHIVNLDSAFDWTAEVRRIWDSIDWDVIRSAVAPEIPPPDWKKRGENIGLIGLVSSLQIESAFKQANYWEDENQPNKRNNDPSSRQWRDRQLGKDRQCRENGNNNLPDRNRRFNGEEPFFQSPRRFGERGGGVVECWGIYATTADAFLGPRNLQNKVPPEFHHEPAIFLCPERIHEIYPIILTMGEELFHPQQLSSNPALVNCRMTLLHELGHHFFPVFKFGGGRFLSEALANLFCHGGLNPEEQAWLFYKTWYLQPAEYSAYRPLRVLCDADKNCKAAVVGCFTGDFTGLATMSRISSSDLQHRINPSLSMAMTADAPACEGLWLKDLRHWDCVSDEKISRPWWHGMKNVCNQRISADKVIAFYRGIS